MISGKNSTPNLFIAGAPKCGTTALATWLGGHSGIYAPFAKEPHHFSTEYALTPNPNDYENLYAKWTKEKPWAIDASVWYLYSPYAAPNILRNRSDAHFIIMLRSPLQMIPSMHRQQIFNGNELELDLSNALALNDARVRGESVRVLNGYPPNHLAYYHSCGLGWQVERLMEWVDAERLHIILHEDLSKAPQDILMGVYRFLNLTPEIPGTFERINAAKTRRFLMLDRAAKSLGDWKSRKEIGVRLGLLSWLRRVNRKEQPIPPLSEQVKNSIRSRMADDVRQLGACLNRDLAHWLADNK